MCLTRRHAYQKNENNGVHIKARTSRLEINFQEHSAGGLEIHLDRNQYYITKCKDGGKHNRGTYGGSRGKNGIWKITKTSGREPRLVGYLDGDLKFDVQLSDRVCSNNGWRNYWSRNVAKIMFNSMDRASVRFRMGESVRFTIVIQHET